MVKSNSLLISFNNSYRSVKVLTIILLNFSLGKTRVHVRLISFDDEERNTIHVPILILVATAAKPLPGDLLSVSSKANQGKVQTKLLHSSLP